MLLFKLGALKKLFEKLDVKEIMNWLAEEPTGQYSRRIWFLYEWLTDTQLDIPDLTKKQFLRKWSIWKSMIA